MREWRTRASPSGSNHSAIRDTRQPHSHTMPHISRTETSDLRASQSHARMRDESLDERNTSIIASMIRTGPRTPSRRWHPPEDKTRADEAEDALDVPPENPRACAGGDMRKRAPPQPTPLTTQGTSPQAPLPRPPAPLDPPESPQNPPVTPYSRPRFTSGGDPLPRPQRCPTCR